MNANDTDFEGYRAGPSTPRTSTTTNVSKLCPDDGDSGGEGSRLRAGRRHRRPALLVNETLAKTFYPNIDPIGRAATSSPVQVTPFTIVGVVKDVKQGGLRRARNRAVLPAEQAPRI